MNLEERQKQTTDILFIQYVLYQYCWKVTECAKSLRKECKNYCFTLDYSNCNPKDIAHSLNQYKNHKLPIWEMFFDNLFPQHIRHENIIKKCDTIFRLFLIWCTMAETKFHYISVFHKAFMIQVFNRLGLCISYNELERIDCSLVNEIINSCTENKVPSSPTISSASIIHGAMNIFNHNENILSGKGSRHDAIYT